MKNFYFDFEMISDDKKTIDFIDTLKDYEATIDTNTSTPIANIFISSVGGENRMAAVVYHFFTTSTFKYNFIVHGSFSSNTILILLALNPEFITIMRQANTIVHLSNYNCPIATIALNKYSNASMNEFNDFKEYLKSTLKLYKTFLSEDEISIIKQGGDVSLGAKRVAKLFKKLKKNQKIQNKAKKLFEITL